MQPLAKRNFWVELDFGDAAEWAKKKHSEDMKMNWSEENILEPIWNFVLASFSLSAMAGFFFFIAFNLM